MSFHQTFLDIYQRKFEKIKSRPSADESEHPTHTSRHGYWLVSIWVKIGTKKGTIIVPEMFCKVGETDAI